MPASDSALNRRIGAELAVPVDPRVADFAAAIAAPWGEGALAVLFYGSCLRSTELDGQMLDFYLITRDYDAAYAGAGKPKWMARANAAIPPNVFPATHDNLVAKVAVLSLADFERLCSVAAGDVSVWARFAQPARLVWQREEAVAPITHAVANASRTLFAYALPMMEGTAHDPLAIYNCGFTLTYGAELRAERAGRAGSVVDHDADRYRGAGTEILAEGVAPIGDRVVAEKAWARFRRRGKMLTLLRLAKASGTYAGGIDYLAWKVNRHAGTAIAIKPWQRKWPILGALVMLPKLLRQGAIK